MTYTLALDIGGSHVSAALVGEAGLLPASLQRTPVQEHWPAGRLLSAWADTALSASHAGEPVGQIACSVPGPFEYQAGVAHFDVKMRALSGVDVTGGLRECWAASPLAALPVTYVNDAVAFTRGEARAGRGQGVARLLGVTLGTGLGSGFLVNGQALDHGPEVPPNGEVRFLPVRGGIADEHLSAPGLSRAYALRTGQTLDARDIAARAQGGDPAATQVYAEFGQDLGALLRACAEAFRPDLIVIGGQLSRAWSTFAPALTSRLGPLPVVQSALLDDANLLGAVPLAPPGPRPPAAPRPSTSRPESRS